MIKKKKPNYQIPTFSIHMWNMSVWHYASTTDTDMNNTNTLYIIRVSRAMLDRGCNVQCTHTYTGINTCNTDFMYEQTHTFSTMPSSP